MKILKIFGVVVGIHLFALILIFANPGCSSTSKPAPAPVDTVARETPPPGVNVPYSSPLTVNPGFNPDAPATTSSMTSGARVYQPTRPNTPAAAAVTATPVENVTPATTYTVKSGDTLWDLSKKFKVPSADIAAQNGLKPNAVLHAGQKLIISTKPAVAALPATTPAANAKAGGTSKAPATTAGATTPTASSTESMKHLVKPGESLSSIAHQYGVSVKDLGTANNISDPAKVKAGAELVIPGWTPSSGSGKSSSKSGKAPAAAVTAPAPAETKPIFNLLDSAAPAPKGNEPPMIKVEDSPIVSPTPKGN